MLWPGNGGLKPKLAAIVFLLISHTVLSTESAASLNLEISETILLSEHLCQNNVSLEHPSLVMRMMLQVLSWGPTALELVCPL